MVDPDTSTLAAAVRAALEAQPPEPRDAAAAALAQKYADHLDQEHRPCEGCECTGDHTKTGPALLAALEALQMTPRARALAAKGRKTDAPAAGPSRLDQLRERRDRKQQAAAGDAAAP